MSKKIIDEKRWIYNNVATTVTYFSDGSKQTVRTQAGLSNLSKPTRKEQLDKVSKQLKLQ